MKTLQKISMYLCTFFIIISCQKSNTDVSPTSKCYMTKITYTTKTTVPVQTNSYFLKIEYDVNSKISKVSNANFMALYTYDKNKVIIKNYDIVSNKNVLKSTDTITLNDKGQVIQTITDNEIEKKSPNYTPYIIDYEYNDKGFISKSIIQKFSFSYIYEYNTAGLPSKNSSYIFSQVRNELEYYDEYKPVDFPNLETLYDYKSVGGYNKTPYTKLIKSVRYFEQNILKKESNFIYTVFADNKKIKNITQTDYNYTSTGVKINTPTTSIQEFEYQCK
jgi:hypothetical protein